MLIAPAAKVQALLNGNHRKAEPFGLGKFGGSFASQSSHGQHDGLFHCVYYNASIIIVSHTVDHIKSLFFVLNGHWPGLAKVWALRLKTILSLRNVAVSRVMI